MSLICGLEELELEDIKNGFRDTAEGYQCLACGARFQRGEVYPQDGRFFDAQRAVREHLRAAHESYFVDLLESPIKYNPFTENQRQLLGRMREGMSDNEIAKDLSISPSTVRHQRFMFREKAKQAKLYLALYAMVAEGRRSEKEEIIPMHDSARMTDERYATTGQERDQILESFFPSLSPLRLTRLPAREKKKIVVLARIADEFEKQRQYTEKEVNQILGAIHDDHATLRRYLIEYGFLDRKSDCSAYWRK